MSRSVSESESCYWFLFLLFLFYKFLFVVAFVPFLLEFHASFAVHLFLLFLFCCRRAVCFIYEWGLLKWIVSIRFDFIGSVTFNQSNLTHTLTYLCMCDCLYIYICIARSRSWFSYLIFAANQIDCENEIINISISTQLYISIYLYAY